MQRGGTDRGVSEVVGFILVFAMVVTAFTVYQGIVVPDQNRQVEFQHNQAVQGQLQELRNAIVTTASSGTEQGVSIELGATYPDRTFATNLGVSAGSLSTESAGNGTVLLRHAQAASDAEAGDFLDGSTHAYETRRIGYAPLYSFYTNAPTTAYENTVLYNDFDGIDISITDQLIVDGRRIRLITVNGSLQAAGRDTVSVSTKPISVSSNRVAIEGSGGENVTITIPTERTTSEWRTALAEENVSSGGYVVAVSAAGPDHVTIELAGDVTYDLSMAKVGVGDSTTDEGAAYVTTAGGSTYTVNEGSQVDLAVEVRDRFNNPISNVDVTADPDSSLSGEIVGDNSETTDSSGRATFSYSASGVSAGTADTIDVTFGDGSAPRTATLSVDVVGAGGGGGGDSSNYDLAWDVDAIEAEDGIESCSGNRCTYNRSKDPNTDLDLTAETTPSLAGVFVDYSTNDSSVVSQLQPSEDTTDSTGQTTTTASIGSTGTVAIFASGAEDSDALVLEVTEGPGGGGGGGPTPQIARRIDDLSHVNENRPKYVTSYSISDTNGSFQYVSVEYANQDSPSASAFVNGTAGDVRGNLRYDQTYGADESYEITVRVIYEDGSGDDYVAAQETVTDDSDAVNPSGNDDLSVASSPTIQSLSVTDRSNGGQGPRYDFDYQVSTPGNLGQVEAYVVGLGSAGRGSQTSTASSATLTVSAGYGYNQQVKLALLVVDDDGAVVDSYVATDTADGSGP